MKKIFKNDEEQIVYIEYTNNIPVMVLTCDPKNEHGIKKYDFEFINGDKKDIAFYNIGSGGSKMAIDPPLFCKPRSACYWMDKSASFVKGKKPNCKQIDKPIQVKSFYGKSINPFKVSYETYFHFEWCKICKQFTCDGMGCRDHQMYNEEIGMLVYHDGSIAD